MEEALEARQRNRCKELGLIVFGFTLHEAQVEAIQTLSFEQKDLLLLAKTGFVKSLIFQLLPFFTPVHTEGCFDLDGTKIAPNRAKRVDQSATRAERALFSMAKTAVLLCLLRLPGEIRHTYLPAQR